MEEERRGGIQGGLMALLVMSRQPKAVPCVGLQQQEFFLFCFNFLHYTNALAKGQNGNRNPAYR